MQRRLIAASIILSIAASAQDVKSTATEELRTSVRDWVETMSRIQQEENDWKRDEEVLTNYKEGLAKEIAELNERIAEAETRRQGADQESLAKVSERDLYAAAKEEMSAGIRRLEEALSAQLPILPAPLRTEPKVAEAIENLTANLALPADKRDSQLAKRLLTVITITTEAEKFQQTVHIRPELHKDKSGREFNMQVIYFGLAMAYAVNEDGSLALSGKPGADGWKFEESPTLASDIRGLIDAANGDRDAAFIQLPFSKP